MKHPFRTGAPSIGKSALAVGRLLSGRYWGELHTFLAVAKAKSLSRAADELGVSRMTAGREIRRLQDAIGAHLVVFSKSGAALTPRGEDLARALHRLDHEIHTLTSDLRDGFAGTAGAVRLSVPDGIGVVFVIPGLRRLSQTHPRICVEIKSPHNNQALIENQTDMIVGLVRETHQDLTCVRMGTLHFLPMAGQSYIDRMGRPTLDDLERHRFIDSGRFSSKAAAWAPWRRLVERGSLSHCCEASIPYAMMVKTGLGVGLLGSVNILEPSLSSLDLNCKIAIPLYLTAVTERLKIKPVRIVFDFVLSLLGADNPWLAKEPAFEANRGSPFNEGYLGLFNLWSESREDGIGEPPA